MLSDNNRLSDHLEHLKTKGIYRIKDNISSSKKKLIHNNFILLSGFLMDISILLIRVIRQNRFRSQLVDF